MNQVSGTTSPYPLSQFYPLGANAAFEIVHYVKAPDAMVGMAVVKAMSLACQGLIDIRLPSGGVRPVTVNTNLICESGDRKSEVEGIILKPVFDFDEARSKKFEAAQSNYETELQLWKLKNSVLSSFFKKAVKDKESTLEIEQELKVHSVVKPKQPRLRQFIRVDLTKQAAMEALEGDGESLLVTSDEGHVILNSDLFRNTGFLNSAFGGGATSSDRAKGQRLIARNPRLSVGLILQPDVLKKYLENHGGFVRGSGHWARYLFAWPKSIQGGRFDYGEKHVWKHLPSFHARMTELITEYDQKIEAGSVDRVTVELSDAAIVNWREMINVTEGMLQPLGYLSDIKDFASKAMEIACRIAAALHWFTQQEGKISLDTFQRATNIVEWHLHEYKRIFSPLYQMSSVQQTASSLLTYLKSNYFDRGLSRIPKNLVLRNGPVRPKARFDDAVDLLVAQQMIWIGNDPSNKSYLNIGVNYGR